MIETDICIDNLDWRLPILSSAGAHDYRCGHHAALQIILRGLFESSFLAYLGMLHIIEHQDRLN